MVIKRARRNQKGFAQIELFVVLYVVGILSMVASLVFPDPTPRERPGRYDGYVPLDLNP